MGTDEIFNLDINNKKKTFKFDKSYSYISIKKIVITSLFGQKDWLIKLMEMDLSLQISCIKSSGEKLEYPIYFASLVSPNHRQPVFDFQGDFVIPEQNKQNTSAFFNHFIEGTLEIKFNENPKFDIKLTFVYSQTPGVSKVNG